MSHSMKHWERVIEHKLRRETRISNNQFGFMLECSIIEAIFLLRLLMEKCRGVCKDLHMVFIDYVVAFRK